MWPFQTTLHAFTFPHFFPSVSPLPDWLFTGCEVKTSKKVLLFNFTIQALLNQHCSTLALQYCPLSLSSAMQQRCVCLPTNLSLAGVAPAGRGKLPPTLLSEGALDLLHRGARFRTDYPLDKTRGRWNSVQVQLYCKVVGGWGCGCKDHFVLPVMSSG